MFSVSDPLGVDVVMVASELVTNVIEYTGAGGELRAWFGNDVLRLEVQDGGAMWPIDAVDTPGARGLDVVDAVAARWGVEPVRGGGKLVWAEFTTS